MRPSEVPWSPFRGLSAREKAAAVNTSPFDYVCKVCDEPITKGTRMLRWRGRPKEAGTYNRGSEEGWQHLAC